MILRTWSGLQVDTREKGRRAIALWALGWIRYALRGFRPARCRSKTITVVADGETSRLRCWERDGHGGEHRDGEVTWPRRWPAP